MRRPQVDKLAAVFVRAGNSISNPQAGSDVTARGRDGQSDGRHHAIPESAARPLHARCKAAGTVAPASGLADPEETLDLTVMSTGELLDAWRDATRAAELADRLATSALRAVDDAESDEATAHALVALAEEAAAAAERAAEAARKAAHRAVARTLQAKRDQSGADQTASETRATESEAAGRYHDAERLARDKHLQNGH